MPTQAELIQAGGGHAGLRPYHFHHGRPAHQHPFGLCLAPLFNIFIVIFVAFIIISAPYLSILVVLGHYTYIRMRIVCKKIKKRLREEISYLKEKEVIGTICLSVVYLVVLCELMFFIILFGYGFYINYHFIF